VLLTFNIERKLANILGITFVTSFFFARFY
jgi:hypothetical protein